MPALTPQKKRVVSAFMQVGRKAILDVLMVNVQSGQLAPLDRRESVRACRAAIDALATFGVRATALSVTLAVYNHAYVAAMRGGAKAPTTTEEAEEWKAQGRYMTVLGAPGDTVRQVDGRWYGHLVLVLEGSWLVDITVDQVNDDRFGIHLEPTAIPVTKTFLEGKQPLWLKGSDGNAFLKYTARPDDKGYTKRMAFEPLSQPGISFAIEDDMMKKLGMPVPHRSARPARLSQGDWKAPLESSVEIAERSPRDRRRQYGGC